MATLVAVDELLEPITADQPAGEDIRFTPEWDRIREARRADDTLDSGKWKRKESKSSDWSLVLELTRALLEKRSKDLQLALFFTEASVKLNAFAGLRDGLYVTRQLMQRYWDKGLYPLMEEGPQDRSGPFEWMNEKLADPILELPLTHAEQGRDFNLLEVRDARLVGSESSWRDKDGEIDDDKRKTFNKALAAGRRSTDMYRAAVAGTKRSTYEKLASEFSSAYQEFQELDKVVDEKFGKFAPSLKEIRSVMAEISDEILKNVADKQLQEPDLTSSAESNGLAPPSGRSDSFYIRLPLSELAASGSQTGSNRSWQEAERLIRSGQVDAGLAEMIRLAASETSGRARFQRKLLLAEICLSSNRQRLARTILEELNEQIEKFHLEAWETSDVVGGVWTRLYQIYNTGDNPDKDRAAKLYDQLCRLDPWQALGCAD